MGKVDLILKNCVQQVTLAEFTGRQTRSFVPGILKYLNKTWTEIALMLTLPVLESYTKMKTSLRVSWILADLP